MKLLLDTHTFLWHAEGSPNVSAPAAALLTDPANELYLSIASVWELAIKVGLNKLSISLPFLPFIPNALKHFGFTSFPSRSMIATRIGNSRFPVGSIATRSTA